MYLGHFVNELFVVPSQCTLYRSEFSVNNVSTIKIFTRSTYTVC